MRNYICISTHWKGLRAGGFEPRVEKNAWVFNWVEDKALLNECIPSHIASELALLNPFGDVELFAVNDRNVKLFKLCRVDSLFRLSLELYATSDLLHVGQVGTKAAGLDA